MCVAGTENDRLRHIRLHERVNELPDPNYAALKYFMGHLHRYAFHFRLCDPRSWSLSTSFGNRITEYEAENAMTIQNLAIVFGPTLFMQAQPSANGNMNGMADASLQNKASPLAATLPPLMLIAPRRRSRRSWSTTPISSSTRATRSTARSGDGPAGRVSACVRATYLITL